MAPLPVQFVSAHIHVLDCRTRLPFRFGIHTLTDVPLCELALDVAMPGGTTVTGRASDLLIPKWFRKDPDSTPRADSMELLAMPMGGGMMGGMGGMPMGGGMMGGRMFKIAPQGRLNTRY